MKFGGWFHLRQAIEFFFIKGVFPIQITPKAFDHYRMLSFDKSLKGCIYLKEFRMMFH